MEFILLYKANCRNSYLNLKEKFTKRWDPAAYGLFSQVLFLGC